MSKLLRHYNEGNTYFVTSVTQERRPFLQGHYPQFRSIMNIVKDDHGGKVIAWVLQPDHFHMILNPADADLSDVIKRIKLKFAYQFRLERKLYRHTVWQRRFWDHMIRDNNDMNRHIDYIHYNPVKHGLVRSPFDWEHSSIHEYRKAGFYQADWGISGGAVVEGEFGE